MRDVAQAARVALGTVSKVFNGLPVGGNIPALVCLPVGYAPAAPFGNRRCAHGQ